MSQEPKERTIPELRDDVLHDLTIAPGNTTALIGRGLLILGVEIVDCLRGIEVAAVSCAGSLTQLVTATKTSTPVDESDKSSKRSTKQ